MLCQMVSDSKRNPDHIISSSIFLQRGQFIEFHIRFTYNIFLPKKKCQRKSFSQIKIVHFVRFQIQMSFSWHTSEYTCTYYSILCYSFSIIVLCLYQVHINWIHYFMSKMLFFFIYFTVQIWETHIPENYIDTCKYGQPCWRYPSILQFRALRYVMYSFVGCYHFWNCDKSNAVNLKFLLNRWHND